MLMFIRRQGGGGRGEGGKRYLQLMSDKDVYIQNITVSEHDNHSDSFQVKFPNVFTNYPLGEVRVENQRFIDHRIIINSLYGKRN